jgi:hypothetical protein
MVPTDADPDPDAPVAPEAPDAAEAAELGADDDELASGSEELPHAASASEAARAPTNNAGRMKRMRWCTVTPG